jgi:hypothetical protein
MAVATSVKSGAVQTNGSSRLDEALLDADRPCFVCACEGCRQQFGRRFSLNSRRSDLRLLRGYHGKSWLALRGGLFVDDESQIRSAVNYATEVVRDKVVLEEEAELLLFAGAARLCHAFRQLAD